VTFAGGNHQRSKGANGKKHSAHIGVENLVPMLGSKFVK